MQSHAVVSRQEWLAARMAHLALEKEYTKARERLSEERRALPWVKVDKNYAFEGPDGGVSAGLFARHLSCSISCSRPTGTGPQELFVLADFGG
jgi:predicted dithiol-disulfide oxidoreductase (DUF899 family)